MTKTTTKDWFTDLEKKQMVRMDSTKDALRVLLERLNYDDTDGGLLDAADRVQRLGIVLADGLRDFVRGIDR